MGDPRKHRKKFSTPSHPWNKERIDGENEFTRSYGLKNKQEIYKANSILKGYFKFAKKFATVKTEQDKTECAQFIKKMKSFAFIEGDDLGKVLDLTLKDILERRLQTLVHRKGISRSMNQARQFITHRHVIVGEKKITMPSYMVTIEDEPKISFIASSNLAKEDHPERIIIIKKEKPEKKMGKRDGRDRRNQQGRRRMPNKFKK